MDFGLSPEQLATILSPFEGRDVKRTTSHWMATKISLIAILNPKPTSRRSKLISITLIARMSLTPSSHPMANQNWKKYVWSLQQFALSLCFKHNQPCQVIVTLNHNHN